MERDEWLLIIHSVVFGICIAILCRIKEFVPETILRPPTSTDLQLFAYMLNLYRADKIKCTYEITSQMCSISWKEFLENANDFIKLSKTYQEDWSLIEKDKEEGNAYLVFRQKLKVCFDETDNNEDELINENDLETVHSDPSSSRTTESSDELVDIEYHVAYSVSYQVPVLYFKGYRSNGKPIGLDDAWKIFNNSTGNSKSREDMLKTLTQSDHPVLFKPFLGLHPCRTGELLAQIGPSQNTVLTFLSIMGPYIRLNLRNEYGLAFQKDL